MFLFFWQALGVATDPSEANVILRAAKAAEQRAQKLPMGKLAKGAADILAEAGGQAAAKVAEQAAGNAGDVRGRGAFECMR